MLGTCLARHVFHESLKGQGASYEAFEGMGLEEAVLVEDLHLPCRRINAHCHSLPMPLLAHPVVLEV